MIATRRWVFHSYILDYIMFMSKRSLLFMPWCHHCHICCKYRFCCPSSRGLSSAWEYIIKRGARCILHAHVNTKGVSWWSRDMRGGLLFEPGMKIRTTRHDLAICPAAPFISEYNRFLELSVVFLNNTRERSWDMCTCILWKSLCQNWEIINAHVLIASIHCGGLRKSAYNVWIFHNFFRN